MTWLARLLGRDPEDRTAVAVRSLTEVTEKNTSIAQLLTMAFASLSKTIPGPEGR